MFFLCLIAAVAGTPLRQAEAASDFARAFGELGQGNVLETIDGGVGDDKEQLRPVLARAAVAGLGVDSNPAPRGVEPG
jgi:hypothetical protein